jgi:L-threonylcarbamoyladenylate synthase
MSAGPEEIAEALQRLTRGGIVAFPTETVYGLGADAFNAAAVGRVFELKGRPANNPLIVHVSGEEMARQVAGVWPRQASQLAGVFWPGPLTIVLPRGPRVPDIVTAGGPTVGVRCPDHPITLALLEAFGGPLVGPSANPSGRVSPTTAEHVREAFTPEQVFVLDGGPCRRGLESTVVALAPRPRVLRPGLISAEEIGGVLGERVESTPDVADESEALSSPIARANEPFNIAEPGSELLQSPGMLPLHYAPQARAVVYSGKIPHAMGLVVVLSHTLERVDSGVLIPMPRTPHEYAARLYAALREADRHKPALIAIEAPPRAGSIWQAVWNRLRRATSQP